MFTVYEGIFGNYELISGVYDLIFGEHAGRIAGNDGIAGVLNGGFGVFAALKHQFFAKKCCLSPGLQA